MYKFQYPSSMQTFFWQTLRQYLVKWKGKADQESKWITEEELEKKPISFRPTKLHNQSDPSSSQPKGNDATQPICVYSIGPRPSPLVLAPVKAHIGPRRARKGSDPIQVSTPDQLEAQTFQTQEIVEQLNCPQQFLLSYCISITFFRLKRGFSFMLRSEIKLLTWMDRILGFFQQE